MEQLIIPYGPIEIKVVREDSDMVDPTWLTKRETADYLRVSTSTVDRWVSRGIITRHYITGLNKPRFNQSEVNSLVSKDRGNHSKPTKK